MNAATAAIVDTPGAEPRLGSVTLPPRTPGTTLLAVVAAPVNPLDLVIASGTFHSARHEAPYVPGSECVGAVLESGRYQPGTLVYAQCQASPAAPGSFASRVLVADEELLPLPAGIDPVLAAVGNSGTAAFMPLVEEAGLRTGETVLVLGATGAVGQLAVQVARLSGAGRVIGVGRSREALAGLLVLGADAVVELVAGEDSERLADRLLAAAGGAVDVVFDGLYGVPLEAALRICAQRARVVNVGNPAGPVALVPAGLLRGKQLTLSGFAGLHTPLRAKRAALTWLWAALGRGELRVDVRTFSLGEFPAAWLAQASSPHAKCVIVPGAAG